VNTSNLVGNDLAESLRNVADILDHEADILDPETLIEAEYLIDELVDVILQPRTNSDLDLDDEDY
jgi:hypothetical protein